MPDPISATVGIGLGVSALASYEGARGQAQAQRRSADILAQAQQRGYMLDQEKLDLAKALIAEGKPWRDAVQTAGLQDLPLVMADINAAPGTSPMFQEGMRTGTRSIMQNLAPYGLSNSSASGVAVGELSQGLLASDTQRITNERMGLLNLPNGSPAAGVSLMGQTGGDPLAASRAAVAGQDPYASLYGDLAQTGSTIGSLGLLKMLNFNNTPVKAP